jgi:hypothetical protein
LGQIIWTKTLHQQSTKMLDTGLFSRLSAQQPAKKTAGLIDRET